MVFLPVKYEVSLRRHSQSAVSAPVTERQVAIAVNTAPYRRDELQHLWSHNLTHWLYLSTFSLL